MKQVNLAASVLLDPSARARYDALRGTGAHLRPEPAPRAHAARPSGPRRAARGRTWAGAPIAAGGGASPISSRLFVIALAMTALVACAAHFTRTHVPVASSDYRVPDPPQMATIWTPGER